MADGPMDTVLTNSSVVSQVNAHVSATAAETVAETTAESVDETAVETAAYTAVETDGLLGTERAETKPVLHVQFHNARGSPGGCVDSVAEKSAVAGAGDAAAHQAQEHKDEDEGDSSSSSSDSSSEENSSLGLSEARPPDGGWGWVVVAASFLVNLIADGITFSFGVIYVEFLAYFGQGKSKTAWIGSLFMAIPLLSGPVASFLTDRYGCRRVCIAGSVLASSGFVLSSFANSVELLLFTFGALAGFGLSLCYVAAVVIVAYYFDKRRSFATGLSVCGSGIGTFIFAPLTQFLLAEYGWRGTTLILAGLFLNMAVCGALMRDLPWTSAKRRRRKPERRRRTTASSADTYSAMSANTQPNGTATSVMDGAAGAQPGAGSGSPPPVDAARLCSSLVNLPTFVRSSEHVPVEVLELMSTHRNVYNVLLQTYPGLLTASRSFSDSGRLHEREHESGTRSTALSPCSDTDDAAVFLRWLRAREYGRPEAVVDGNARPEVRRPSRPRHSRPRASIGVATVGDGSRRTPAYFRDLRVHRLSLTYRGAMLNINRYRLRASSCPDIYRNSMTTIAKEKVQWYAGLWEFRDLLVDMLDLSHFSEPRFLLFALSNFLLYTWYDVPYVYLTDNAIEMGFSDTDGSMLISIIGIVNMVGEIVLGWAGDKSWVNPGLVYALCMGLCGAVTALVPLLHSYYGLCAVSGAFGLFIAANYSLTSIILVELITIERFTNAYGLLLLVQGVANLIGPPLAGWLYDITGTYHLSFYLAGLFIALSGVLLVVLPATKRYRRFQSLQRLQQQERPTGNGCASPPAGREPRFYTILASCITGSIAHDSKHSPDTKINHV